MNKLNTITNTTSTLFLGVVPQTNSLLQLWSILKFNWLELFKIIVLQNEYTQYAVSCWRLPLQSPYLIKSIPFMIEWFYYKMKLCIQDLKVILLRCDVNQYSSIFLISQYSPCTCKPLEAAVSVSLPKRVLYMYVVVWLCPLLKVADNSKFKKNKNI